MNTNTVTWARLRPIGKGSFGTVSLARDSATGRVFAAKSVDLKSSPLLSTLSLENEIRILSSLNSPYIVSYLDNDTTQESTSLNRNLHMEYLPGGTATDAAAVGKMEEQDVRAYTLCIARGLHYLHCDAGVVHGDVKGRNVLLGPAHGVAKLVDFGSASRAGDGNYQRARGTPLWMAPEVVRGEAPAPASDVWSLGCTVVEMAGGGAPPWRRFADAADVMLRIGYGNEVPEFPAGMSKAGQDFLDKCLRRDADERWTSEQLLQHPFLAAAGGSDGPSPRSVLDWANLEFTGEGSDDDEEDGELAMDFARERVVGLAANGSGGAAMSWWGNEEDWEVVRGEEEVVALERRGEEGSCGEFLNCGGENVCSVSCSCCSGRNCCCCGCDNKRCLWFQETFGASVGLLWLLRLCWMWIVFLRVFNGIVGFLFHFDWKFLSSVILRLFLHSKKLLKLSWVCGFVCSWKTNQDSSKIRFLSLPSW